MGASGRGYDFRTGSELSREALSQLRAMGDRLAAALGRVLSAYLESPARFEVTGAVGRSFEELTTGLPRHGALGLIQLSAATPALFWQVEQALIGPIVSRMLGGPPEPIERPATTLEAALLRRFLQEAVDVWATAWERLARRQPLVVEVLTESAQLRGKIRDGETVLLEIAAEIAGTSGTMAIVIPVPVAHRLLGEREQAEDGRDPDLMRLKQSSDHISVPVSVILHRKKIMLSEAAAWRPGDVIELGKPVAEPMVVTVHGRPKFLARTGISSSRLAAQLLGPCDSSAEAPPSRSSVTG
jgi:flagellar motor switch protein FliM